MRDYSLICPDGFVFEFDSKHWTVDMGLPDGMGLPPVEHISQKQFKQPGELIQDIHVGARLVTITGTLNGDCLEHLHKLRRRLFNALRWNRTNSDLPVPTRLRYRLNNKATYLNCFYAGDLVANVGTEEKQQTIGIKLMAYDPMWYGTEQTAALAASQLLAVSDIVAKIDGVWNALGNVGTGAVTNLCFSPDKSILYIGGTFLNWNGDANSDRIVMYNIATGVYSNMGTPPDGTVSAMAVAPDGTLYVVGNFTHIGGIAANRIAKWDGANWTALGAGLDAATQGVIVAADGVTVYATGLFANAGGAPANFIAKWNGAAWSALGTGLAGTPGSTWGRSLALDALGNLYVTGQFDTAGGVATPAIAKWNGAAWLSVGGGLPAGTASWPIAISPSGLIYVAGSLAPSYTINCFNGASWTNIAGTCDGAIYALAFGPDGVLYAAGAFTVIGGVTVADKMAKFNGSTWAQMDIDLPGAANVWAIRFNDDDIYIGFDTNGNAVTSAATPITNNGDVATYPIFAFTGPGTLQWIENAESGKIIILNITLVAGEVVTIDLSPGVKTLVSSSRGDLFPYAALIPLSDFGSFALEPDPIAPLGVNTINVLMTGTGAGTTAQIEWTNAYLSVDAKVGA